MGSENLRIVQLTVENVKRVQAVTITPKGSTVVIGGLNRQGKSSTLDAIAYALGGGKLIPSEPIRKGAKHARIEVDLGELIVERKFTKNGSTLTVTPKDGPKFASPQTVLDKLIGKLSFDPLVFLDMKPADQLKTLKELVGINFDDLDAKREKLYDERKDLNRDAKNLEGQLEGIPEHSDAPEPVKIESLMVQIEEAETYNGQAEEMEIQLGDAQRNVERHVEEFQRCEREIDELRQKAISLQEKQKQHASHQSEFEQKVETLQQQIAVFEKKDTAPLKEQIRSAEEINQRVREREQRKIVAKEMRSKTADAMKLTLAIEDIDAQKEARLAQAKFPVPGLSFGEDGVLLNNIPLEQASSREQIETVVGIGFAMNPGLKIALVRNASLIDDEGLATIAQIAEEKGGQIWLERVGHGKECQVIIEDGLVAEQEDVAAAA